MINRNFMLRSPRTLNWPRTSLIDLISAPPEAVASLRLIAITKRTVLISPRLACFLEESIDRTLSAWLTSQERTDRFHPSGWANAHAQVLSGSDIVFC